MRIRARFSITTPSTATATVTVVGAVKALVSLATEITAPKAAAVVTAGILAMSAAYAVPKANYVETPKISAAISFPVKFMDGATPSDTVAIRIDKILLDVSTTGDAIDYFTFVKVLNDAVTTTDSLTKVHTKPVDFDQTDADVDPDPAFATDFPSFDLTRPDIADSVATSDVANKHTTKVRQDVATTSDGIDYLVATKVLVDTAVPSDVINSFVLVRPDVADTATTSDADAKAVTKPDLASAAAATDAAAYHPQTVYTDAVGATDAIDYLNPTKVLQDTATTADAAAKDLTRPDVADTAVTSDADAKQVTKPDLADSATATDSNSMSVTKVATDTATTSDANAKTVVAVLADSVAVTDVANVNIVPVRFFTEDSSTADNLRIAEFTTGVDSRSINGYAIDESQFN
jgi:hypothetical protein